MDLLSGDDRYAKAEALQAALKSKPPQSPPNLQIVCLDFFISKVNFIVWRWKDLGENIFDQLPNPLRTDLLNHLLSTAHLKIGTDDRLKKYFYELTCMLMNETTVKLDYEKYSTYSIRPRNRTRLDQFRLILANAALKCPKLERLAVHGDYRHHDMPFFPWAEDPMSPRSPSGIHNLLQLEGLRHLDIFGLWCWTDEGLNALFSHLKQLITLKIVIHAFVTEDGFENIHLLKELEEFHYVTDNPGHTGHNSKLACHTSYYINRKYAWTYNFLAQNVRSLKLIGASTMDYLNDDSFTIHDTELKNLTPEITGTSNLEHLHSNLRLPEAQFPNLQHLFFFGPISSDHKLGFLQKFATFTHLTTLIIGRLPSDVVAEMLELVGKQLSILCIYEGQTGDLFQILHFCPNLVKFQLFHGLQSSSLVRFNNGVLRPWVQTSKYEALVTKHNVRLLEHFEATFDACHGGKDKLFELVVFAPLMKDLRLLKICISRAQCQLIHNMEEGKLSKLESFFLSGLDLGPSCSMGDVGLMIQCLVCSAPRLNSLDLWWIDEDLSAMWGSLDSATYYIMELVPNEWCKPCET